MNKTKNIINNRNFLWAISLLILGLYFFPYFTKGQNVHIMVYDNLDSNIVWFKILAHSGKIFSDSMEIIPNMMNGLPRLSYGSEFNILLWLYYFFDDFSAYVINDIIVHIVAFFGMLLLLSHYIIEQKCSYRNFIIFTTALVFALIPFWSNGGLSVSGQPLVLYAFLNIRSAKNSKWDWLILVLIPFYSSFILSFFFFLFAVGLVFVYDTFKTKQINYKFLFAIFLMTSLYLSVEYRLVYNMLFDSGFISHRTEFNLHYKTFDSCFRQAHFQFLNGQNHNINLHYRFILPTILLGLFLSLKTTRFSIIGSSIIVGSFIIMFLLDLWDTMLIREFSLPLLLIFSLFVWLFTKTNRIFPFLFIIQIIISYWTGFHFFNWPISFENTFSIFNSFHLRFMMLQSFIWYILLAFSLQELFKKLYFFIYVWIGLLIAQIILAYEYRLFNKQAAEPATYKSYYGKSLYKKVEQFIQKPKESYHVLNIGIEPAIALYNGFYTADGYSTNYPLSYKHKFRKLIQKYLDTLPEHQGDRSLIDDWGSKLYILTGRYRPAVYNKKISLKRLPIDTTQFSNLNIEYIFSAYKIEDYQKMHLKFLKKFKDKHSNWPLYLYQVDKVR